MRPIPVTVKRLGKDSVEIVWNDGHRSLYLNRFLRDHCPCAGCRRPPQSRSSLPVLGGPELYPVHMDVVGRYAIAIHWSDRHDTGIYHYDTLRALCPCAQCQQGRTDETPA